MDTLLLNADATPMSLVPLSAIPWEEALRLVFLEKAKVIKDYEHWTVRSQHLELAVPSIIIMADQVKYRKVLKYSRTNVYLRDDFTCQLQVTRRCRSVKGRVNHELLTIDHVNPRSNGGKTSWLNVCTSCKDCNSFKGNDPTILPITQPRMPTYYEILNKRKKFPISIREAEWRSYIDWPEEQIRIYPPPIPEHNR